jgi:hypothetical protein
MFQVMGKGEARVRTLGSLSRSDELFQYVAHGSGVNCVRLADPHVVNKPAPWA